MVNVATNIPPEAKDAAWTLAEHLTFSRTADGRSLAGTARNIGVSTPTLRNWEEGDFLPGLAAFVAWATELGYEVALIPVERG